MTLKDSDSDERNSSSSSSSVTSYETAKNVNINPSALCFKLPDEPETTKSLLDPPSSLQANRVPSKMPAQLKLNYACICIFAFLLGTDFAVIIPTLWDRLSVDFDASGSFMGLVLSSYSLSGVICGLIMGIYTSKLFYRIYFSSFFV